MLNEDDILSVVLKSAETRDALRVIVRVAIREATLRAKAGPPVEDVTVIGNMCAIAATVGSGSRDLTPWRQSRFDPLP